MTAVLHYPQMPFEIMPPACDPPQYFPPALPPSPPPPASTFNFNETSRYNPWSLRSQTTDTTQDSAAKLPRIPVRSLSDLLNLANDSREVLVAVAFFTVGVAATVQDPSSLPNLKQLGVGLVGTVCAGGIVYAVLPLERVAEGVELIDVSLESVWGQVWRWLKDRVPRSRGVGSGTKKEEEEGMEVTTMFDKEGRSVFLLDEPQRTKPVVLMQHNKEWKSPRETASLELVQTSKPTTGSLENMLEGSKSQHSPRSILRAPKTSLSPRRTHHASSFPYPTRQSRADRTVRRPSTRRSRSPSFAEDSHSSGILGPSPMPKRHAEPGWKHFTGQGFWKHQQKLDAVAKWSNPGNSRSLQEIMWEVEEKDRRGEVNREL